MFDHYPDTRSQVYRGVKAETSRTNAAVKDTAGKIVTYEGNPAVTYYFSTSGGKTENVELSFLGSAPKPWLKSVEDPYDDISPNHRWRFRFTPAARAPALARPGKFRKIRVISAATPRASCARGCTAAAAHECSPARRSAPGSGSTTAGPTSRRSPPRRSSARSAGRTTTKAGRRRRRQIAGVFDPAPRSRSLLVERRVRGRWRLAGRIQTTRAGRYVAPLATRGVYRVRAGRVAGPAVRVR